MDLQAPAPARYAVKTLTGLVVYNALLGSFIFIFCVFVPPVILVIKRLISYSQIYSVLCGWLPGRVKPQRISVCRLCLSNGKIKAASAQQEKINNSVIVVDLKYDIRENVQFLSRLHFSSRVYLTTHWLPPHLLKFSGVKKKTRASCCFAD